MALPNVDISTLGTEIVTAFAGEDDANVLTDALLALVNAALQQDGSKAADSIQFDLAAAIAVSQGQMAWNADEETCDLGLNGAVLQLGQEVHWHVRNDTGSLIPDGTAVMATGTIGASGRITIGLMDGSNIANAKFFLGITTEDIAAGTNGKVTSFGKVRGIKTDYATWADGDVLWTDNASDGDLTNVMPTSGIKLPIAFIIHTHATNGTIAVRATDGTFLAEAHDTQIASPADGEVLQHNGTAWVNSNIFATANEYTKTQNFNATTLSDGANISWDLESNQVAKVTLTDNRTLDNPTNMKDGATYILRVIQDVGGTNTLAYGNAYLWEGGTAPTLTTDGDAVDILTFTSDGTSMFGVIAKDFS
jgi:hypothetical protein